MRFNALMLGILFVSFGANAANESQSPQKNLQVLKASTPAVLAKGVAAMPDPSNSKTADPKENPVQPPAVQQEDQSHQQNVRKKTKAVGNMPGVGKLPGSSAVFNANVVPISASRNEVVYMSNAFANRISTPFRHPKIVGNLPPGYDEETVQVVGSSMYFPPIETRIAVFLTGSDVSDQVLSLTLEPKDIPSQTITLALDGGESASSAPDRRNDAAPNSYTDALIAKFRTIAMGKIPAGFSSAKMPPSIARSGELIIIPEERFSGSKLDIYRYRVENSGKSTIELAETGFYEEGVRAVAIYPNLMLNVGEFTYVFVVADKSVSDQNLTATKE